MPTDLLNQIYATGGVDAFRYRTLELIHSAFVDEQGNPDSHRIVSQTMSPLEVRLESNTLATFLPANFEVKLPQKNARGREDLQVTLSGVSHRVAAQLERQAEAIREPIRCIFREYVSTDLSAPARIHSMTLANPRVTETKVTASATYAEPVNQAFPSILYTLRDYPSL